MMQFFSLADVMPNAIFADLDDCKDIGCAEGWCWGCVPMITQPSALLRAVNTREHINTAASITAAVATSVTVTISYAAVAACEEQLHVGVCTSTSPCALLRVHPAKEEDVFRFVSYFCILAGVMYIARFMQYVGTEVAGQRQVQLCPPLPK